MDDVVSPHNKRWFDYAMKLAQNSPYSRFNLGAVVVYHGKIIGEGCNDIKTHPMQEKYNKYRNFNCTSTFAPSSIHAEIKALTSIPYPIAKDIKWNQVKLYVVRLRKITEFGIARPCPSCLAFIKELGITLSVDLLNNYRYNLIRFFNELNFSSNRKDFTNFERIQN